MDVQDYILIDEFLKGNLSGEQLEEFNHRVTSDEVFKEALEYQQIANTIIINQERIKIKSQLQLIHQQNKSKTITTKKWWGLGVGLTFVVIILTVWILNRVKNHNVLDNLKVIEETAEILKINNESQSVRTFNEEKVEVTPKLTKVIEEPPTKKDTVINIIEVNSKNDENNVIEKALIKDQSTKDSNKVKDLKVIEDKTKLTDKTKIEDPCLGVNQITPKFELIKPCFGGERGSIHFENNTTKTVTFSEFSIDGGQTYVSSFTELKIDRGNYEIEALTATGCKSKKDKLVVNYADCNFVIQPKQNKYWELSIPESDEWPITLEIRNARTGVLIYQKNISDIEQIIWQGVDQNNNQLDMGNYVYWFKSKNKGLFAKGQITIVN